MNGRFYRPVVFLALCLSSAWALGADPVVEKVSVSSTAHFDFDKTAIRLDDQSVILAEVAKMQNVTWQAVTAVGHTDSVGASSYNERLSRRRAEAVKAFLVGKGLAESMIRTGASGPSAPVASNDDSGGRARNRRTEITFQGVRSTEK